MKWKLACMTVLTIGAAIGGIIGGRQIQRLKQEQNDIDRKLEELRRQEFQLLDQLERYHKKTDEEIRRTMELITMLNELDNFDPMKIDIRIDPE